MMIRLWLARQGRAVADGQVGWVTVTNKRPGTLKGMLWELFSEELGVVDLLYLLILRTGDLEFCSLQIYIYIYLSAWSR